MDCSICRRDPDRVRKPKRREIFFCENCNRMICFWCMKEIAISQGVLSEEETEEVSPDNFKWAFMPYLADAREDLCPACFGYGLKEERDLI